MVTVRAQGSVREGETVGIDAGEDVIRPYTPITLNDAKGHFELLVKAYSQGVVSRFMADLAPGDSLEFRGPIPKLQIAPNMKKRIGMIAGGTGILIN